MALLPALLTVFVQWLWAGPLRTGMGEVQLSSWRWVRQDDSARWHDQWVGGIAVSNFLNDNFSIGVQWSALDPNILDSSIVDGKVRAYFCPLANQGPWLEARLGGGLGFARGNAWHWAFGGGWRWIVGQHWAIDVQPIGVERWSFDLSPGSRAPLTDWNLARAPWLSRGMVRRNPWLTPICATTISASILF